MDPKTLLPALLMGAVPAVAITIGNIIDSRIKAGKELKRIKSYCPKELNFQISLIGGLKILSSDKEDLTKEINPSALDVLGILIISSGWDGSLGIRADDLDMLLLPEVPQQLLPRLSH